MKKFMKVFTPIIIMIIVLAVVFAAGGMVYLTANRYSPDEPESVDVFGAPSGNVLPGDTITLMTYNIGYGIKDNAHDSYEDGGKTVIADSLELVSENVEGAAQLAAKENADVIFFQDVDIDSKRSFELDEASLLAGEISGMASVFSVNQLCLYAPYPVTNNLGYVRSGSLTLTKFPADSAERRPFVAEAGWPDQIWSRQPCMLVQRLQLDDSTKELVLVNAEFEKYASTEMKVSQYKALCEFMQIEYAKGNYVIAGGGFYSALPSVAKNKYTADEGSAFVPAELSTDILTGGWKYCTDDSIPTMRLMNEPYSESSTSVFVTDGFITSPNTIVESTKTVDSDFRYSAHNPVVTTVTLVK